jgi:4'-phosphopantetheinyl transferase
MEVAPGGVPALWHLLDAAERARADRFRFAEDRESYVAAHALLRTMLSRQAPVAPADWRFVAAAGGKPMLDPSLGQPHLTFSLSHTRGMVACAVGAECDLGVDAEHCERALPVVELAQRFFAPAEAGLIASLPPAQRDAIFYRLWTLKEAYTKAIGLGIAAPFGAFAFRLEPPPVSIALLAGDAGEPDCWQFAEWQPAPRHRLALAVRCPAAIPHPLDAAAAAPNDLGVDAKLPSSHLI